MNINKKQKNKKIVAQNKRNRMVNRRYSSTIKTLSKLFLSILKTSKNSTSTKVQTQNKANLISVANKLFSFLDKAVKKNVLHKNNSARKKATISKILCVTK